MAIPDQGRPPPLDGPVAGLSLLQQQPQGIPEEEKKSSLKAVQSGPLDLPPQDDRPLRGGLIRRPEDLADVKQEEDDGAERQLFQRKEQPLASLQKPYYYSFEQREIDETEYLTHIVTGGFLGTGSAQVKKTGILTPDAEKYFRKHHVDKMREDGLYIGGADKLNNPSVNRLEQRLIREGSHSYFKSNGELKLHTQLLAGSMTHPTDFSTEVSKSYSVRVVNALLSERLHQYKNHYYRMDIAIGRLQFTDHPFFSKEQRLCTMMREAVRDFDQRSNRRVIPFLQQRQTVLEDEMQEKENDPSTAKSEIQFVKVSLEEVKKRLEQETDQIQKLAGNILQLWGEVKNIRAANGNFVGDPIRLRVKDYVTEDNLVEYDFKLKPHQSADNIPVPRAEKDRRRKLESQKVALVLIVNDQEVARTKNQKLQQNFEADFDQIFQLKLYSMPTSIKLKLLMGGRFKTELATIDVPIPGEHVYAMTSAAALTRQLPFQADAAMGKRFQWVDERERNRPAPRKKDSERERMNQAAELQEEAEEQQIIQDQNYLRALRRTRGSIIIKAGWVGKGPKMPPTKIENLFSKTVTKSKTKAGYEALPQEEDAEDVLEDINDPLNLELVKRLKESKNRELKKMLEKDALNPLADVDPLRHKLLRAKELYPQLHKLEIPLDDRDIIKSPNLMSFVRMIVEDEQEYRGLEERDSEIGGVDEAMKDAFARNKAAHDRRREFEEKMLKRQKQIKIQGGNVYGLTPKAIVKQFEFGPQQTCFTSCMKAIFKERGRNLRPHREEIKPLSAANYQKCEISIHVIKGNSLPIREKFLGLKTQLDQMRSKAKRSGPIRDRFDQRGPRYPQQQGFQQQPQGFPGFQGQGQPQGFQGYGGAQPQGFLGASDPYNRGMQQQNFGQQPQGPIRGPQGNFGFPQGAGGFMDSQFQGNQGMDPASGGYLGGSAASGVPLGTMFDIVSQLERVRTIVEVRLSQIGKKGKRSDRTVYTSNTEGPNPDWNEIVHIPYTLLSQEHFSMQQLLQEEAILYLNIFDVVKELKKQSYGQVLYTWEKRFLGMVEIPLMTVFQNRGKMDAVLRVRRPLLMFDYQTTRQSLVAEGVPRPQQQQVVQGEAPSYVTVSIRLQPAIQLPSENQFEHRSGLQDGQLISRGVRWLKSWRKKSRYKDRVIKVFAQNVEGKSIYLPRFLSPQKPPLDFYEENADDPYAIERVVRYVSLIPFADDNKAFQDMPDIFCTSQQFLDFGSGDYEEHAILLCNYFNYIDQGKRNIKSYLVFGMGYPQGYTAYVLRRNINTNSVELWNAVTGEGYYFPAMDKPKCCTCWALFGTRYTKPFEDPKCPLKEIGCIISDSNVYVNVQETSDPAGMSFNLDNKKLWKPFLTPKALENFFSRAMGGVGTVNPENLDYTDLETHLRQQLEEQVELYIAQMFENERASFRQDRRPLRTLWRTDLRDRLRAVLVQLEQFKFKMRNGATDSDMIHPQAREEEKKAALLSRLKDDVRGAIGPSRQVFGFPLNKSYTKRERMWEEVKNTDIHNVPDEEAEFALACAVFNYPCTVYSVWIYVCCIQREKN